MDDLENLDTVATNQTAKPQRINEGPGWVYVLQIEDMPNWYKIGETSRSPEERMGELERETGCPGGLRVTQAWYSNKRQRLEREVHHRLQSFRRPHKEWFVIEDSYELLRAFRHSVRPGDRVHLTEHQILELESRARSAAEEKARITEDKLLEAEKAKREAHQFLGLESRARSAAEEKARITENKLLEAEKAKREAMATMTRLEDTNLKLQHEIAHLKQKYTTTQAPQEPEQVSAPVVEPTKLPGGFHWALACIYVPVLVIWLAT